MPKMSIEHPAPGAPTRRLALNGPTMGTRWSAIAYGDTDVDALGLEAALAEACQRVDDQMSTWKPNSDLMRLNRMPVGEWAPMPDELAYVLGLGEEVRRRSHGLFDMAVFGQVQAAGFGSPLSLEPGLGMGPGVPALEIDLHNLRARRLAHRAFDLSGIAKGFGVDLMARTLETFGVANYLISIDGELQAGGRRGDGRPWMVALEAPQAGRRDIAARIQLCDASLATSGDYRHRRESGEGWTSHTIDPRTGRPAQTDLASVTVMMPDCVLADAWATALLVAGSRQAAELCRENGLNAILARRAGDTVALEGHGTFSAADMPASVQPVPA